MAPRYSAQSIRTFSPHSFVPEEEYDEAIKAQNVATVAAVASKIQSLYDAGTPLFTRETIKDIDSQLEDSNNTDGAVSVRGLDGTIVKFEKDLDSNFPWFLGNRVEEVLGEPRLQYFPVQNMMMPGYALSRYAYCPLRVGHSIEKRDRFTKQPLDAPCEPVEKVRMSVNELRGSWENSEACEWLRKAISLHTTSTTINKVVGFALGTMSYKWKNSARGADRSVSQHLLLRTLGDILSTKRTGSTEVACYAQDPAYTTTDKDVLEEIGVTVLDDPKGFLEVDNSTAVISCCPNVAVKQVIADVAQPSLLLWDTVQEHDTKEPRTDPDSPRVRTMVQEHYKAFPFPGDLELFGHLTLYVRAA